MAITPLSTRNFLDVRPMSSSPSTSPVFTIHRIVKDSADAGDITNRALGMNMHGYKTGVLRVVPSANANPIIEVLFWSGEAGKFVSRVYPVESGAFGDGAAFDLSFKAFGSVVFVKVRSGVDSGDTVTVTMAGSQLQAAESDVLLHFSDIDYTGDGGYLLDPLNNRLLGPFAENELPYTTYQGRKYAGVFEARENLTTYSQQQNHADWLRIRLTSVSADAGIDPLGGATADMMIPNSVNGGHYLYQEPSFDGSSKYVLSWFAKKTAYYDQVWLGFEPAAFTDYPWAHFDLDAGTVLSNQFCDNIGIEPVGDGWYFMWITATSTVAVAADTYHGIVVADNKSFAGDNINGLLHWQADCQKAAFPSSPIKTEAGSGTRAKDQPVWPAAIVPHAAMRNSYAVKYAPFWTDNEGADGYLGAFYKDLTHQTGFRFESSNDTMRVNYRDGGAPIGVIETVAVTHARNALLTGEVYPTLGRVTLSGYATGNGTKTGTAWAAYITSDKKFVLGAYPHDMTAQINGLICEPYRPRP